MKKILFPTDFSSNAIHAAQYAGMLAKRLEAEVVLLHGYPIPIPSRSVLEVNYDTEISVLQSEKEAKKNMASFAAQFIQDTGLNPDHVTQIVEYGSVSDIILDTAKSINADMIVIGTKGATNAIDRWLGTNAQSVMNAADCPVWIVPQNAEIMLPKSIMYAADFEEDEITATNKVLEMAKPLGATCKIVHVQSYFDVKAEQNAQKMVNVLEGEFENEDVSINNINYLGVVDGLETYIEANQPDILALGIYEKSFLSKIFNSSISQHFVQEAKLPLLTFKK